ncbi:MAG: ROK family protein [Pyrinomonadaceae bacterium]
MAESQVPRRKSLGIEVSSSVLNCVYVDRGGAIEKTFRKGFDVSAGTVEQVADLVREVQGEVGEVESIGLAVPGLIHGETKRVAFSVSMPSHAEVDLARGVSDATGLPTTVENDANAAAYGEFRLGAGRESRNLFYATLGEGVGGAFIFDGEIWRGRAGFAGEFGYLAINSDGVRLEDVASSANIVRRTRDRMHQDSTSSLSSLDESKLTLADILSAAGTDDDLAIMMLERTGEFIGTAIANVINLLNVETVVLGGELMEAGHYVLDAVLARARQLSFAPSFVGTRIVTGTLGRNAAAAGSALIAQMD